jgi:hypothetical protein
VRLVCSSCDLAVKFRLEAQIRNRIGIIKSVASEGRRTHCSTRRLQSRNAGTLSEMAERRPCKFEGQPVSTDKARGSVTGRDFADLREIDTNRRRSRAKRRKFRDRNAGQDLKIIAAGEDRLDQRGIMR